MIYDFLNPENALVWRIVHRDNLAWLVQHGIQCANSTTRSMSWVTIGNQELIDKRDTREVPIGNGGTLNDYVPFYFTPFSPMLYNIYTGYNGMPHQKNEDIIILVSSLHKLQEWQVKFIFTDMHAYSALATFHSDLSNLDKVDWSILQKRDFKRDINDLQKMERYQAEALIYDSCPITSIEYIVCYSDKVTNDIQNILNLNNISIRVATRSEWYF